MQHFKFIDATCCWNLKKGAGGLWNLHYNEKFGSIFQPKFFHYPILSN